MLNVNWQWEWALPMLFDNTVGLWHGGKDVPNVQRESTMRWLWWMWLSAVQEGWPCDETNGSYVPRVQGDGWRYVNYESTNRRGIPIQRSFVYSRFLSRHIRWGIGIWQSIRPTSGALRLSCIQSFVMRSQWQWTRSLRSSNTKVSIHSSKRLNHRWYNGLDVRTPFGIP